MPLRNPKQQSKGGTFTCVSDEHLSRDVLGVRLPVSVHQLVKPIPNRSDWLRRVITEAAQRELMPQSPESPVMVSDTKPVMETTAPSIPKRGRKPKGDS